MPLDVRRPRAIVALVALVAGGALAVVALPAPAAAEDAPTRGPAARGTDAAAPGPPGPLVVRLDGTSVPTTVHALGDGDGPAADDLLRVGAFWVARGPGTRLEFRSGPGRLWRTGDDGAERLVGVTVVGRPVGEAIAGGVRIGDHVRYGLAPEADTFGAVADADLADLACVRVVRPTAAQVARLGRLDLARVVFVDAGAADDPLPALPAGVRHLVLGDGLEGKGPRELADLAGFPDLVSLALGARTDDVTDLHPLAGLVALRALDLGGRDVRHVRPLARLTALRRLDAAGCVPLEDVAPLSGLARLHTLDVSFTAVADLTPLARLPALRALTAVSTRATTLPREPWPAIRTLRLIGTDVPPAELAAFAARHPACALLADARSTLRPALEGVTRVRVRTGGTCHRVATHERTLAEVADPGAIAAFVGALRFAAPEFADDAADCGSPTFELFAGDDLRASLGLHGGVLVRWAGGGWPGDARLAPDAADAVAAWAAARGIPGPRAELAAARRREAAERHRVARYRALLPADAEARLEALGDGGDDDAAAAAVGLPPSMPWPARLTSALRLLGAGTSLASRVPAPARAVLLAAPPDALAVAATAALDDPETSLGLARWMLDTPAARGRLAAEVLDGLLPRWLDRLLGDPTPEVVADGVALAAVLRRPVGVERLRRHLEARASVLAAGDAADPFERAEALRLVDALAESGDAAAAARLGELAAGWPREVADRVAATSRRVARERALLPGGLRDALETELARGGEPGALLAAHVPDLAARARLAFRLVAITDDRRAAGAAFAAAREALAEDASAAARAAVAPPDDAEVLAGAGTWLLELGAWPDVAPTTRDDLLTAAVPHLLGDPSEARRVEVVSLLGRVDGAAATALLRRVLAGRPLSTVVGPPPDASHERPAVVFAAACALLDRDDDASVARIRALAPTFAPPERAWIEHKLAQRAPAGATATPRTGR